MATTRIRTTRIYYDGDGSTVDFTIPFEYLAKRFVQVFVDNELQKGGTSSDRTAVYYFANPTTIRFNVAPASGTQVLIKRFTDATDRIVTFQDASVLRADDLNAAQLQTMHIAEEGRDIIDDALIVNTDGNWDARNRRIVNLADPIDPQDAMTYKVYLEDAEGANAARDEAVKAAEEAKEAAASAAESAASAAESAATAEEILEDIKVRQQDVTNKHDVVVELAAQIEKRAEEVLKSFDEAQAAVAEATETVLEVKDYIEEIVNNNVVQSGLACARSVWVLEEDLPKGTVIRIPHSPTYIVGRKHLFVSYDGIVMSPTFYNEVGEFNTSSTEISFNFDLFKGQELMAWVVTLGNSDSEIYDRLTDIETAVTQAQTDIENLQQTSEEIIQALNELAEADAGFTSKIESLESTDSEHSSRLDTLESTSEDVLGSIEALQSTDAAINKEIEEIKAHMSESGEVVIHDGYGTITVDGTPIVATIPEDTLQITAGANINLTVDAEQKTFEISADVPEPPAVPLELVIVDSLEAVPSELKVGGLALVKEGYDE